MTWREFELRARGYFLRLGRQKWMIRELIYYQLVTNGVTDVERKEIMRLPWDEPDEPFELTELTPEKLEETKKRFTEIQNRQNIAKQ